MTTAAEPLTFREKLELTTAIFDRLHRCRDRLRDWPDNMKSMAKDDIKDLESAARKLGIRLEDDA